MWVNREVECWGVRACLEFKILERNSLSILNQYAKQLFFFCCCDVFVFFFAGSGPNRVISRACEKQAFNDCQTANAVRYCYCNKSLCNGKFQATNVQPEFNDDDEDADIEGSGSPIASITTLPPKVSVVAHGTAPKHPLSPLAIIPITCALFRM